MRFWLFAFVAVCANMALAEFVYSPETGWTSTDKNLETRMAQGLENPEALRLMNTAAATYAKGDEEKARKIYRDVVKHYPTSLLAPQAYYQIAKIRLEQKQVDKAYEAYGHIVGEYPSYPAFDKLLAEMFELAEKLSTGKTGSILGLWNYRERDAAIEAFEKIVSAAPYSDYAPKALMLIAQLYTEKGEKLSAIDAYERLISSYPTHPLATEAYLNTANAYRSMVAGAPYDQGATQQAIRYYDEFATLYPTDPRVPEAQGKLQQMKEIMAQGKYNLAVYYYEKRKNSAAANNLLKEVLQISPEGNTAQQSQQLLEKINQTNNQESEPEPTASKKSFLDYLLFWK